MALDSMLPGEGAGTLTSGQRVLTSTAAARRVPQWITEVFQNESEGVAPFLVMSMRLKGPKIVKQASYTHMETDMLPHWVEILSFSTDGDGTGVVLASGHGDRLRVRDTLYTKDREVLLVTAIVTDTLTVTRGLGNSSATTLVVGDDLEIGSSAFAEGASSPAAMSQEPTIVTNYCQTSRQAFDVTGRVMNSENYGDKQEWARLMKDAGQKLNMQKETALLHGFATTTDATTTAGYDELITTNVTAAGGTLTESTLNTFLKTCYRRNQAGSKNLIFFTGELLRDAMDGFGRDNIRYEPTDKVLGIAVGRIQNSHGNIPIVNHGLLTVQSGRAGLGYFINLDKSAVVEFAGRGMLHRDNIHTPDVDGRKDELLTDFGLWLANQKSHGRITGVTG